MKDTELLTLSLEDVRTCHWMGQARAIKHKTFRRAKDINFPKEVYTCPVKSIGHFCDSACLEDISALPMGLSDGRGLLASPLD